jgi:hypothetical protein
VKFSRLLYWGVNIMRFRFSRRCFLEGCCLLQYDTMRHNILPASSEQNRKVDVGQDPITAFGNMTVKILV